MDISKYIMGILFVLALTLGFTSYTYHADKVQLQKDIGVVTGQLKQSEDNLALANKSCEIAQTVTKDVAADIDTQQTTMTKTLEALATVPPIQKDNSNATSKYADDASLSPELMRLLDTTYCSAVKTDPTCTASGTPSDVSGGKSISR